MGHGQGLFPDLQSSGLEESSTDKLSDLLMSHFARTGRSDLFEVSVSGGHFQIRAALPGYKMHSDAEDESDQPLRVDVVGRSLVLRGWQASEHAVSSFQRSFRLPRAADVSAIHVAY